MHYLWPSRLIFISELVLSLEGAEASKFSVYYNEIVLAELSYVRAHYLSFFSGASPFYKHDPLPPVLMN